LLAALSERSFPSAAFNSRRPSARRASFQLDRIAFTCGACHVPGGTKSVAVDVTHLFLEGQCPQRGCTSYGRVELAIADAFAKTDASTIQSDSIG
jgi:hypothetical protein